MEELREYEERKVIKFFKKTLEKRKKNMVYGKKFKHTDFNKLIKEFKSKNKIKRKLENENQINTSNDIKNAIVLMKNLIKKQKYGKNHQKAKSKKYNEK